MHDTKTYCFGRFLIDLPKTVEVNGQAYEFMFGKIESERFTGGEDAFGKKMREGEATYKAVTREGKYSYTDSRLTSNPTSRILVTSRTAFGSKAYGFEAYRYFPNGILFSMKETAFSADKIDSVLSRLETRLLPNLRYRRPEEIPGDPGFCIENGFIADDGKTPQHEWAEMHFKFKQWPDVTASVLVHANGEKLGEPLLARMSKPRPVEFAEVAKQIKSFRRGKRNVGMFNGEEILDAYPTDDDYFVYRFAWESQGEPRWSLFSPHIHIELETGNGRSVNRRYMRPSLTDKQTIELFDTIVNSIRLRPTTPGKTSDADNNPSEDSGAAKRLPLGTQVSSLRACPESGVYECASDAPGVEQRRVFIEQGRPMPGAFTTKVKRGLAGLLGAQESKEVETSWTLVAYSPEP